MGTLRDLLRRLSQGRRKTVDEPRTFDTSAEFADTAARTLHTLRPEWQTEVAGAGLIRIVGGQPKVFDLRHAYAHHLSTGIPAREVLAAAIALMLQADQIPQTSEFLVPLLRPAKWVEIATASADLQIPSAPISTHVRVVVGFAVDGSMRYANTTDIESLGLSGTQAIDRATRNVLDGALVGLEPARGEANVWHLRAERGYPGAVLARGADALRKVCATSGIKDLVCALSTDQEIVIADLAQPSAIDALMQIARPIGRPVPPLSLGCVLLSGGSEGTWHELPSPSTELFVSLAAELRDLYPDATVVLPSQRHDGRGNSFWVAEWELNAGRFVLPVHMDVLLVSPPRGHKRAQTLPRVWNDVRQVVSIMSTTPHTARHFVVDVADARLTYRSIERLPLARTLGSESR